MKKVIAICKKHGVFIISDEIHCDFTYPGHSHTVLAKLAGDYLDHVIVCTSPSKSFNLAGLQLSHIFIPHGIKPITVELSGGHFFSPGENPCATDCGP